jgi:hypothetical protein
MGVFPTRLLRSDQRKAQRHQIHIAAHLEIPGKLRHPTCIIHDISEGGARLTVGPRSDIPDVFTLVMTRNCRVVRRAEDEGQLAVEFLPGEF